MKPPSEEALKKFGYTRFESNERLKAYCDFFYQRRIIDDKGTRYFIEFWHYPPYGSVRTPEQWVFEMNLNEPHSTMQIHRPETIEFCEVRASSFWRMMGSVYYEEHGLD